MEKRERHPTSVQGFLKYFMPVDTSPTFYRDHCLADTFL